MLTASRTAFNGLFKADTIPLGFGCASLVGAMDRKAALGVLQAALDAGISYFDTARMYGHGEAEGLLGELVPANRSRMVLVSKGGILPPSRTVPSRIAGKAFRAVHKLFPSSVNWLRSPASTQPRFDVFDIPALQKSLEDSLRALRTDHLDLFLLHEVSTADARNPALAMALDRWRREGKFRAVGLAGEMGPTLEIIASPTALAQVVQIPSNPWNKNIEQLPTSAGSLHVTHSGLGTRFTRQIEQLRADAVLAARWSKALGMDATDRGAMATLFLAHALAANPGGMVLFSSTQRANIERNAAAVRANHDQQVRLAALSTLVAS